MDPSRIAVLQLWVTAIAIFLGPLAGVLFTFWFQRRSQQRDVMERAFLAMMAHRKAFPIPSPLVESMNTIDVIFHKNQKVRQLYHEYYDLLCQQPLNHHLLEGKQLDLLSAMAKDLGYRALSQTDIGRFYSPKSYQDWLEHTTRVNVELLRVLEGTERLQVVPRKDPQKELSPR